MQLYNKIEIQKKFAYEIKEYGFVGRCLQTQLYIDDLKKEDTSFFKNSSFIDSILNSDAEPIFKSVLHIMLAKRLDYFQKNYFYRANKNLYKNKAGYKNYNIFSLQELDSTIDYHVQQSVNISKQENVKYPLDYLWLSSDPLQLLFKPTYLDIVTAEQISFCNNGVRSHTFDDISNWMMKSPDEFIQDLDKINHKGLKINKVLKLYRNWAYGHKKNKETYYFIETLARKFLNNYTFPNKNSISIYNDYLEHQIQSPYGAVKANCVYQYCLLLNSTGIKYMLNNITSDDTIYRFHYAKALQIFAQNEKMLDSFGMIKAVLQKMKEQILNPYLEIITDGNHIPNQKINLITKYKNVDNIYIKIIKTYTNEVIIGSENQKLEKLKKSTAIFEKKYEMPMVKDYQKHKSTLDFSGLSAGSYYILYSKDRITSENKYVQILKIEVSNIAILNNDSKVFVLNKTTGFPLENVTVLVKNKNKLNEIITTKKNVNKAGYVNILEKNVQQIYAVCNGDTSFSYMSKQNDNGLDEIYEGENFEDLIDYYFDNMELHMFTDRSIYRPGQTVHYKGIITIRNSKTAELVVLNKKNLKLPFFAKLFSSEVKDLFNGTMELNITDPFNKDVDTIKIKINDYGSFTGTFKIPVDAATGEWEFETKDIDQIRNNTSFKVEEYKRPTFEISIQKPTSNLNFGEDFIVKAKVKSFSGAALSSIKIKYDVLTRISYEKKDTLTNEMKSLYFNETIIDTTGFTDDAGEIDLKIINDTIRKLQMLSDKKQSVFYFIQVEAIDATGESHEEELEIEVSNRPIAIQMNLRSIIEKNDLNPIKVSAKESITAKPIDKRLEVKLYKIEKKENDNNESNDDFIFVDGTWKYALPTLKPNVADKETLIQTTRLNSNAGKYNLPKEKLFTGKYKVVTTCIENNIVLGESTNTFTLIDKDGALQKNEDENFYYLKNNSGIAGEKIDWLLGNKANDIYSIYQIAYYKKTKKGYKIKNVYDIKEQKKGVQNWSFFIPKNTTNKILITHVYVLAGEIYIKEEEIFPTTLTKETEIIVEQYRSVLTPGSKEKFVVSIKTKNENVAAEIMTTMYDASLDKIEKHKWELPNFRNYFNFYNDWTDNLNNNIVTSFPFNYSQISDYSYTKSKNSIYWLNPMDYAYSELKGGTFYPYDMDLGRGLMGKVSGLQIINPSGLESVVIRGTLGIKKLSKSIGYSTALKTLRGLRSLDVSNKPFIILDGAVYKGELNKLDINSIVDGLSLKGADATALYGAQVANGVLILSTKGSIVLPKPEAPNMILRKNFSETAFFFPQVHADAEGFYSFNFSMPESVTEWKWKILSHTKNAIFSIIEKSIFTQLPLMVQPNMPRFLYQGDKIILQSRITNLDTLNINGSSYCTIEDAITGENITAALTTIDTQKFAVAKKSNSNVPFTISVPENFLHPIKIKVSASTNNFSDGEEYTIPIMSKKVLVAQPQQFVFNNKDTTINTPTLPADASAYGISLHIKPKPQAALLNALPYLAFYQFNCAEQTFNKMLAYSVGAYLMRTDTSLQKMQKTKLVTENKIEALPLELSEQTMPWLQLNTSVAKHQKDLNTLLDTLKGNKLIKKYFNDIYALQNNDGGIAWFKEGKSDAYISNYILQGFGRIKKDKLFKPTIDINDKYNLFLKKLITYCDAKFLDSTNNYNRWESINYLNARKYHVPDHPLDANAQNKIDSILSKNWKSVDTENIGIQASLIQASMFFGNAKNKFGSLAKAKLESIKQLANTDDAAGVRWKELSNRDDLSTSNEEAIVAIAEAFETTEIDKETIKGIINWLLYSKNNHNWSSTKSTADVVTLLNRNPNNVSKRAINITLNFDRLNLSVTDNLFKENLSSFAQTIIPTKINLKKDVADIAIGNLNYYYLTATPPNNEMASGLKITKKLYRINNYKEELINENTILKIADKIKTVITIENAKQLKYVFIDEKRAAGLEPKDAVSGYEYGKGFGYYQSVRDVGYQFFAEQIPSGIHTITYYTTVAKEGIFYNGVVALQCIYSPNVKAYGNGSVIQMTH